MLILVAALYCKQVPDPQLSAPEWMQEYASWHRQHRNDPDARYLMYSCHDQMNGQKVTRCGGHGNRIKHICWTLRAAAASRRVLLVDWLSPEHLEEYLGPVAVDWRPNAAERAIFSGASSHVYKFGWPDVRTAPPPPGTKYLRVTGGSPHDAPCYNCTGFQASFNSLYGFLFRPTAAFREHVRATRVRLFGGASAPYVSMHVRMGDSAEGSLLHTNPSPSPSPNPNPNPNPTLTQTLGLTLYWILTLTLTLSLSLTLSLTLTLAQTLAQTLSLTLSRHRL